MPELVEMSESRIRLNLHEGQTEIWDAPERFVFMIAGTQGGKTSFGPWWLLREIYGGTQYWPTPEGYWMQGRGGGDYIAATSSYDLFKLKMLPETLNVFEHLCKVGRYYAGDMVMELRDPITGKFHANRATDPMWGRIILRSATAKAGLESATAKAAWLDEVGQDEFPLSAWEAVIRRLSLNQGRVLGTTTPYNLGWLLQQVVKRAQRGDKHYHVVQFASTLNPNFPQAEFDRARETMPGWKFRMFYLGQFERPAGMIYSDFVDDRRERGGHRVEPFEIPHEWVHYVGIDPGAPNMATWWMAHDIAHDVYYVYRVTMESKKSTREHAEEFKAYANRLGYNVVLWTVGAKSEEQQRIDFQDHIHNAVEPPIHDVEAGIDRIIGLLRQHRIFFFEDDGTNGMDGLFDEIATYSRELNEEGEATAKIKNKETFHRLDAGRYCVAGTSSSYEDAGAMATDGYQLGGRH